MKPSDLPDKWDRDADEIVESCYRHLTSEAAVEVLRVITATMHKCADELRSSLETRH